MSPYNELTYKVSACRKLAALWALTVGEDCPHPEVAAGQPDDGGLVQLRGDGRRQRQELGQFIKLSVLLLPPCLCGVLAFLFHLGKFYVNNSGPIRSPKAKCLP